MSNINVWVVNRKSRKYLQLEAVNSETGEKFSRSARTTNRKEAEKQSILWQAELERGNRPELITWDGFIERFQTEHIVNVSPRTAKEYLGSLRDFARSCGVKMLREVNEARIARFRKKLEEREVSLETIGKHLRALRVAINFATDVRLLNNPPKIRMPRLPKGSRAKGRAITREEFDRMLDAAEKLLPPEKLDGWRFFLQGLWWSGLRLGEALSLSWDEWHDGLSVDLSHEHLMLRIPGEHEKGRRDRLYPVAPEFAELLLSVPQSDRDGFVFNAEKVRDGHSGRGSLETCCKFITRLGKTAKIVVNRKGDEVKFASAQDLRRAFGTRWSSRVRSPTLQKMMRHSNIETTLRYYVTADAEELAAEIYAAASPDTNVEYPACK